MKVAVLLSGGVDSSVSLKLLQTKGYDITAFYLKIWLEDELSFLGSCPWEEDLVYVRELCDREGIKLEVISLQKEYHDRIVTYTINEIRAGRTPNPDILCNKYIKFGVALDYIGDTFDMIATGHYARINKTGDQTELLRSRDLIKDQTYFLAALTSAQLNRIVFPIGCFSKAQVREYARTFCLKNAHRKDSQGICFLGKLKFNEFIHHYLGNRPGPLIEIETDTIVGEHNGFWYYTIGQRQGSGLAGGPWYVVAKDPIKNKVFISRSYYASDKPRDTFYVEHCNWISGKKPNKKTLHVKMRHGPAMNQCTLWAKDDGRTLVTLHNRDQGIASGQFAVFYDGDVCLGSALIS